MAVAARPDHLEAEPDRDYRQATLSDEPAIAPATGGKVISGSSVSGMMGGFGNIFLS